MICPQCNNNIREGLKFCPSCGFRMDAQPQEIKHQVRTKPKRDKNWVLFGGLILLAVAFYGAYYGYEYYKFRRASGQAEMFRELGQFDKCAQQYGIITARVPKDMNARMKKIDCLLLAKKHKDAVREIEDALEWKRNEGMLMGILGQTLYEMKDYKNARRALESALDKEPENRRAHQYLGLTLEETSDDADAVSQLEQALKGADKRDRITINLHLGRLEMRNQNPRRAIDRFKAVLDLETNHFAATMDLTRAYLAIEDFKNAAIQSERALRMRPTDKDVNFLVDQVREKNQKQMEIVYLTQRIQLDQLYMTQYDQMRKFINLLNEDPAKYIGKPSPQAKAIVDAAVQLETRYQALTPPERLYDQNAIYMSNAALLRQTAQRLQGYVESGDKNAFGALATDIKTLDEQNQRMSEIIEAQKKMLEGETAATATQPVPSATGTQ